MAVVLESQNTNSQGSSSSVNINLPTGITAGDVLIIVLLGQSNTTPSTPAGWTKAYNLTPNQGGRFSVYKRTADGGEGATVNITTSPFASFVWRAISYRISGATEDRVEMNLFSEYDANGNNFVADPDPPSLSPAWGSAENLWIALAMGVAAGPGNTVNAIGYPTGYTNTHNLTASDSHSLHEGSKVATSASEDPSVFTLDLARGSWGATLAIGEAVPASSGTDALFFGQDF